MTVAAAQAKKSTAKAKGPAFGSPEWRKKYNPGKAKAKAKPAVRAAPKPKAKKATTPKPKPKVAAKAAPKPKAKVAAKKPARKTR